MKLLVALCTILTFQLCLIGASELEEHDVEDQDMEMEEGQDMEIEDDYIESNAMDLNQRGPKHCKRGWGGQCITDCVGQSCDYIWNNTISPVDHTVCPGDEMCCVDCNAPKQTDNCGNIDHLIGARRQCCRGEWPLHTMESGCSCCGHCRRTWWCRRQGGHCVTENEGPYPLDTSPQPNSRQACIDAGWILRRRACSGKHCWCCYPPIE